MTALDVTESAPTGLAAEPDGRRHEPTAAAAPACTPTRDVEAADAHRDTDADGPGRPAGSMDAKDLERGDRYKGHRDAGHPCEMGRVGPLERLGHDPDAERRDGEEDPGSK